MRSLQLHTLRYERQRRRAAGEAGFTLVELLTVAIIIGILAAVALSVFLVQKEKAFRSQGSSALRNVALIAQAMRGEQEFFEADLVRFEDELETYTYLDDVTASTRSSEISISDDEGPSGRDPGTILVLATRAGPTCYFTRLERQPEGRFEHHAAIGTSDSAADSTVGWDVVSSCTADKFTTGTGAGFGGAS